MNSSISRLKKSLPMSSPSETVGAATLQLRRTARREPPENLLLEPIGTSAAYESDVPAMARLHQAHGRGGTGELPRRAVGWDQRIVERVEHQGRHTDTGQMRGAAGALVVVVGVAEAVQWAGERLIELTQALGPHRCRRIECAGMDARLARRLLPQRPHEVPQVQLLHSAFDLLAARR